MSRARPGGPDPVGPSEPEPFLHLPDSPRAVALARAFVAERLPDCDREPREVLALITSELVANAYRHGHPPVRISMSTRGTLVRLEVHDYGPPFDVPAITARTLQSGAGWGLGIVAGLSTSWGVRTRSWDVGKHVWCDVDTAGPFPDLPRHITH